MRKKLMYVESFKTRIWKLNVSVKMIYSSFETYLTNENKILNNY